MVRNSLRFLKGTCNDTFPRTPAGSSGVAGPALWWLALARLLAAGCLFTAFSPGQPGHVADGVRLVAVEGLPEYPGAVEEGAIRFACAADQEKLETFFVSRGAEFNSSLVGKRQNDGLCHIYYEPTIPGFRASPDDAKVRRLFTSVDPFSLVVRRKPIGDSLSILKAVLARVSRPLEVTISTHNEFQPEFWPEVTKHQFPATPHSVQLQVHPGSKEHLWAQDYLKPGEAGGRSKILVTRRLFEGHGADGAKYRPFLDSLNGAAFVRSKLSWEGGDLQFVCDPGNPHRRILFHGGSAYEYWGLNRLTPKEFEYVLRTEFGADSVVDLSAFGPHADFLVSFLPADRIALVASAERENHALARAAAKAITDLYGSQAPGELLQLAQLLDDPRNIPEPDRVKAIRLLQQLLRSLPRIPLPTGTRLDAELSEFFDLHCPGRAPSCFNPEGTLALFRANPELMKRSTDTAADHALRALLTPRLLVLIESQLSREPGWKQDLLDSKAEEIRRLGFRVIRAPYLVAPKNLHIWAGVSYVNLLRLDRMLFVPTFGLGAAEDRILADLAERVGENYRVIPVDARFNLASNGGVHCTFAAVRDVRRGEAGP